MIEIKAHYKMFTPHFPHLGTRCAPWRHTRVLRAALAERRGDCTACAERTEEEDCHRSPHVHRHPLIVPAALLALACALFATQPVQGRLTQGSGPAPAPRAEVLGIDQQPPGGAVWVSQPLDARGYHSVTVNLTTLAEQGRVDSLRILGRNTPTEDWCVIGTPKGSLHFGSGQLLNGRRPVRGSSLVFEGLHTPEIAVEVVAASGPPPSGFASTAPGQPFTISAYLE